jgi:hypothetical protein
MPEFIHPTTGLPPSATKGYDFFSYSLAISGQHDGWDVGLRGLGIKNIEVGNCFYEGYQWQLGNHVKMTSDDGLGIVYAHMERRALVRAGQRIAQGTVLGYVGATGIVTASHLHFAMSYATMAQALAKVEEYGGIPIDAHWRTDLQRAFVNPAILINKQPASEEDDVTIIIQQKYDTGKLSPGQYIYSPERGGIVPLQLIGLKSIAGGAEFGPLPVNQAPTPWVRRIVTEAQFKQFKVLAAH